jgi:hypothetical protein
LPPFRSLRRVGKSGVVKVFDKTGDPQQIVFKAGADA